MYNAFINLAYQTGKLLLILFTALITFFVIILGPTMGFTLISNCTKYFKVRSRTMFQLAVSYDQVIHKLPAYEEDIIRSKWITEIKKQINKIGSIVSRFKIKNIKIDDESDMLDYPFVESLCYTFEYFSNFQYTKDKEFEKLFNETRKHVIDLKMKDLEKVHSILDQFIQILEDKYQ